MFVNAIERVGSFTRPIFTIARTFGSSKVLPSSATLFFINDNGVAITSKAIAKMIIDSGSIEDKYNKFKEKKIDYKYAEKEIVQMKVKFADCVDILTGFQCTLHPKADLAIVKFDGYNKLRYTGHAVFAADGYEAKPGKHLCRLGYPFPEFTNYIYNIEEDQLKWTQKGIKSSPRFPTEGMVTRFIGAEGLSVGIEMSTPGFNGQNGGPLFDEKGIIHGMQSGIGSLNLGNCVHVKIIKDFLKQEGVKYYTDENSPTPKSAKIDLSYITAKRNGYLQ